MNVHENRINSIAGNRYDSAIRYFIDSGFWVFSDQELRSISDLYTSELRRGVEGNPDRSIHMLESRIHRESLHSLKPGDKALVLEIGGTNERGAIVEVNQVGEVQLHTDNNRQFFYSRPVNRTATNADEFVDDIAGRLSELAQDHDIASIAVIYSFRGDAIETEYGVDVIPQEPKNKGTFMKNIHTMPFGARLFEALKSKNTFSVKGKSIEEISLSELSIAVMGDAIALLDKHNIGGVVGTGFNIGMLANGQLYNTESAFMKGVPSPTFANDYGDTRRGYPHVGKQIEGGHLGTLFEYLVTQLKSNKVLPDNLQFPFNSEVMSSILDNTFSTDSLDLESWAILKALVSVARYRSAQLAGTLIGTGIVTFSNEYPHEEIKVPMEGSVFWKTPWYQHIATDAANRVTGSRPKVAFVQTPFAPIIGAGSISLRIR